MALDVSLTMSNTKDNGVRNTLSKSGEDIAFVLSSLANRKRLELLASLLEGPQTFSVLQRVTGLGKTALAHHLRMLLKAGIVKHVRRGCYELSIDGAEFVKTVTTAYASSIRRRELEVAKHADYIQKVHTKQKEEKMKEFEAKIVRLKPMRVASAHVISTTPENDAWEKMREWAEPKGLLEDLEKHPVFGFNNPNPSPDLNEYGYEFWIRVEPDIEPEGDITIKEFEGGLYAVTTCKLKEELESEFFQKEGFLESWKKLVDWVKSSKYKYGKHQGLEKAHDPNASEEQLLYLHNHRKLTNTEFDIIISIYGEYNTRHLALIDPKTIAFRQSSPERKEFVTEFMERLSSKKLKWIGIPFPCNAVAQEANIDFHFLPFFNWIFLI